MGNGTEQTVGVQMPSKYIVAFKDGANQEFDRQGRSWPIAVFSGEIKGYSCHPVIDAVVYNNLMGRLLTIVEATIESPERREAIKSLFRKELASWNDELIKAAMELASGGSSSENIYLKRR